MNQILSNIRIVLVNPSHPGNIGAAARAMKTMGLSKLYLVQPLQFPHGMATAMASGADDILSAAQVFASYTEALQGCSLVVGATARLRKVEWPQLDPRECAARLCEEASSENMQQEVALVFGREDAGLTNEELDYCQYLTHIPANPEYSSLNLAAAVQLFTYEIRMHYLKLQNVSQQESSNKETLNDERPATAEEFESFFEHFKQALSDINYLQTRQHETLLRRLRRIFNRVRLSINEIQLLRGILSAFQGRKSARRE